MIFHSFRRPFYVVCFFPLLCLLTCTTPVATYYDPEPLFRNPPQPAKPGVLWVWMGSNVTKEGITADLEALKEAGFGKATMSSLADVTIPWSMVIKNSPTPQVVTGSDVWWQLVKFAASECERLGIEFGMFNCPGYGTSGGNRVTPEQSMQELCWTETWVWGQTIQHTFSLPRPTVNPLSQMPFPVYDTTVDSVGRQSYQPGTVIIEI